MTDWTLVIALSLDAARLLGGPAVHDLPAVQVVSAGEARRVCGRCAAWYLRPVVYLREDVDLSSTRGRAILLHELVHHRQAMLGHVRKDCHSYRANEIEAYAVQNAWTAEQRGMSFVWYMPGGCR